MKITIISIACFFLAGAIIASPNDSQMSLANFSRIDIEDSVKIKANDTFSFSRLNAQNTVITLVSPQNSTGEDKFKYIFPVVTLLLGIAVNKGLERLTSRDKLKKAGRRWLAEIRGLGEPIRKQIEVLDQLISDEEKGTYTKPRLEVIPSLDCSVFKSLDKGDLFKYVQDVRGLDEDAAIKKTNSVHGYVSTLEHHYTSLTEKFQEYLDATSMHVNSLTRNLQSLSAAIGYYGVHLEKLGKEVTPENYPLFFQMMELFHEQVTATDGKMDIFELHVNLFSPLMVITSELRHDEKAGPITEALIACNIDVKGIRMEKQYWCENLKTLRDRYIQRSSELDEVVSELG